MAQFRPAGLSDDDSDSDDYGFYEKPVRKYYQPKVNLLKKVEVELQDAIINGKLAEVESILKSDLKHNVNLKLDSGWTPLMHACFHAQDKIVEFLLNAGADPNLHSDSVTPIMAACSNSGINKDAINQIVNSLIERECILNIGDKYGQTPLMRAIGNGHADVVTKLLDKKVNIEMRDQQGWTAVFWAVHHNQAEILEILINAGARLTEVDKCNRTPLEIASSHDHQTVIDILEKNLEIDDDEVDNDYTVHLTEHCKTWHDYYPGIKKGVVPTYKDEILNLLYGMSCERLTSKILNSGIDFRTFLLLEENDMLNLGIEMPYERQRLKVGLRNFHLRDWKLNAVAGLYARQADNYSVLDYVTTLGNHLQQIYILEASLQYTVREYNRVKGQLKFEPPDSPVLVKMKLATKNMVSNIKSLKRENVVLKKLLIRISRNNPQPADLITEETFQDIALGYAKEIALFCSIGILLYQSKKLIVALL